jgi:hypothetical protein
VHHVFISYSHHDSDSASLMREHIKGAGMEVWMSEHSLQLGQEWSKEIDENIRSAFALVVVITPDAKASEYVNYEWSFAVGAGVPVFPVLLKQFPDSPHPRLERFQRLDFRDGRRPWAELITALQKAADAIPPYAVRVPPDAPPLIKDTASKIWKSSNPAEREGALKTLAQMADHPVASQPSCSSSTPMHENGVECG